MQDATRLNRRFATQQEIKAMLLAKFLNRVKEKNK
jgi:hypothetical protein